MGELYIGLNSGTSMDGIDAGLFEIDESRCATTATLSTDYPPELRQELLDASRHPERCTLDALGRLDTWVGQCFAGAATRLVEESGISWSRVRAIGSHGQTIRHQPEADKPFTMQVGDPNVIAARTATTTVADFRRRDLAFGGQGAPLASAFHRRYLSSPDEDRAVVNIGGIANVTVLPRGSAEVAGCDTGPGNTLLDAWAQSRANRPFDAGGQWGDSGHCLENLLATLLRDPYFSRSPPKSTGFEYFNLAWLEQRLPPDGKAAAEDVQATLAALTARTIGDAIRRQASGTARVLVCGGGVHNDSLMRRLSRELAPVPVESTASHGVDPDWVEAATFAWLARRCLDRQPGNLPEVTGASRQTILGGVFFP
jgi:anhydro-N-acetylmuramic acid kinase